VAWNVIAWVLQALLALIFVFHSILYAVSPDVLTRSMRAQGQWPPAIPEWFRRFIGIAELVGAIGLVGPAATRILPWLTPVAAACLAFVTLSASVYHLRRREPPFPLVLTILCLVVVFLRWQVVPI